MGVKKLNMVKKVEKTKGKRNLGKAVVSGGLVAAVLITIAGGLFLLGSASMIFTGWLAKVLNLSDLIKEVLETGMILGIVGFVLGMFFSYLD